MGTDLVCKRGACSSRNCVWGALGVCLPQDVEVSVALRRQMYVCDFHFHSLQVFARLCLHCQVQWVLTKHAPSSQVIPVGHPQLKIFSVSVSTKLFDDRSKPRSRPTTPRDSIGFAPLGLGIFAITLAPKKGPMCVLPRDVSRNMCLSTF
eukprot:6491787-Amphidinium_carterae.2